MNSGVRRGRKRKKGRKSIVFSWLVRRKRGTGEEEAAPTGSPALPSGKKEQKEREMNPARCSTQSEGERRRGEREKGNSSLTPPFEREAEK